MIEVKVTQNMRLDQVVYEKLGSLARFEAILQANRHLIGKEILNVGDIVYLPDPKPKEKIVKEKALW